MKDFGKERGTDGADLPPLSGGRGEKREKDLPYLGCLKGRGRRSFLRRREKRESDQPARPLPSFYVKGKGKKEEKATYLLSDLILNEKEKRKAKTKKRRGGELPILRLVKEEEKEEKSFYEYRLNRKRRPSYTLKKKGEQGLIGPGIEDTEEGGKV